MASATQGSGRRDTFRRVARLVYVGVDTEDAAAVNPVILERQVNEAVDAQGRKVTGGTRPGLNFAVIAVLHPPLNRRSIHHRTHAVN